MDPNTDNKGALPDFLTAAEVVAWFRVGLSTIYHWRASGRIPSVTFNGVVRFPRHQLTGWMQQHTRCPSASSDPVPERVSGARPRPLTHRTMGDAVARVRRRLIPSKNPIHHGDGH
jgi:excisionase family DNA binding protein